MKPFLFNEPIRTKRLILRPIEPRDFDDVHAYMSREDVAEYLLEDAYTIEKSTEKHPIYTQRVRLAKKWDLILVGIEFGGRIVGDLDVTVRDFEHGTVEIGWRVHPDFQGTGIATEAALAILRLLFDQLGAHRVIAELDARNTGSARLCARLGMRLEAHHVKDMRFKGAWSDTLIYAILDEEWAAAHYE